jgi:hypothetical protein
MVTVAGKFRRGRVELDNHPPDARDDDPVLVTFTESKPMRRAPVHLLGSWKGRVPDARNIDALLREIRTEWMDELDDYK